MMKSVVLRSVWCVALAAVLELANTQPTCPADSSCLCSTDVHLIFGSDDFTNTADELVRALVRSDSSVQIGIYECETTGAVQLSNGLNRDFDDLTGAIGSIASPPSGSSIADCPVSTLTPGSGSRQVAIYILPTARYTDSALGDMTSSTGQQFEVFVSFPLDAASDLSVRDLDGWLRAMPRKNLIYYGNFAQSFFDESAAERIAQSLTASAALGATSIACSLFGAATSIVTLDGVPYNFQGHGEYWLSYPRNAATDGVQVRLEPCLAPTGDQQTTCATAFAISSGTGNILEIERVGANNRLTLRRNGELQEPLPAFQAFDGIEVRIVELLGTSGEKERDRVTISTPAANYEIQFLETGALFWMIPDSRARGSVEGLCGNYNGCRLDEFMTADREGFAVVNDAEQQYRHGESYRVTEADTLFTHRPSERYLARSSFSPLTAAVADQSAIVAAGCDRFGEAFEAACSFQLAVDASSPHLFTAYWEACTLFCSLGVSLHGYLDESICKPVCSPTPPLRDSVPFCSVVENDLGGECAEVSNAQGVGFILTAESGSYLQYLGLGFTSATNLNVETNLCNLILYGTGMREFPSSITLTGYNGDSGNIQAPFWSVQCPAECERRCFGDEIFLPGFEWNLDTVSRGTGCSNFDADDTIVASTEVTCIYDAPFVVESAFDARDFARSTIERPNDAAALFYASSNRGGVYELELSVGSSCGTATRQVDVNVMCKEPAFTVDAGANQTVGVTPLGYAEIQMSATATEGSTPLAEVAAGDGRNVQMQWVFTQLPMSVFRSARLSNGLDDLTFTRDSLGSVLLENFALPEIVEIFDDYFAAPLWTNPLNEADAAEAEEQIPLAAGRLFDAVSPPIRGAQSTMMRWQPPSYGTYRLAFQVDDGCRVVSSEVDVDALCPDCDPVGVIIGSGEPGGSLQGLDQFQPRVQVPGVNWVVDDGAFSDLAFQGVIGVDDAAGADHDVDLSWSLSVVELSGANVTHERVMVPAQSHSIRVYEEFVAASQDGAAGSASDALLPSRFSAPTVVSCGAPPAVTCQTAANEQGAPFPIAGARCCSPGRCVSVCLATTVTYDQALAQCRNLGMELCTLAELTAGVDVTAGGSTVEYNAGSCCTPNAVAANAGARGVEGACGGAQVWVRDTDEELCPRFEVSHDDDFIFPFDSSLSSNDAQEEPFPVPFNQPPFEYAHVARKYTLERSFEIEQSWTVDYSVQAANDVLCEVTLEGSSTEDFGDAFDTSLGTSTSFYDVIGSDVSLQVDTVAANAAQCQGTYRVSLNTWSQCEARADFIDIDVTCGPPPVAIINALSSTQYDYGTETFGTTLALSGRMSYVGGFVNDPEATGNLDYAWNCEGPGLCGITTSGDDSEATLAISGSVAGGIYTVSLTVDDGCQQSTTTRAVIAECGDQPEIDIAPVAALVYNGATFPTGGAVTVTSAAVNGAPQVFSYTITPPPSPAGVSPDVLSAQSLFTFMEEVPINENSPTIQLADFNQLHRGGQYNVAASVNDGCQSATDSTTLDVECPRTFGIADLDEVDFSVDDDGGRVYLSFELDDIECDGGVCTGDDYTGANRVEYEWLFVSWPGQSEGAGPPPFGEGTVIAAPNAALLYDAFANPAGTQWANAQASFQLNQNGCPAGVANPFECTSFVPRRPGTYELALVVYDGCHFVATPPESYLRVEVEPCDGDEPTVEISDDSINIGGGSLTLEATNVVASDFVGLKWVVVSAPEYSSCISPITCAGLFSPVNGATTQFTPDVAGDFDIEFVVDHYFCGEQRSDVVTLTATCVNELTLPDDLEGNDSEWLPRESGETTSTGHFTLVMVEAGETGAEALDYWWTIVDAPADSLYAPQCYGVGYPDQSRNNPNDDCQYQLENTQVQEATVTINDEGTVSDAAPYMRSQILSDAQAEIDVPAGLSAQVDLTTTITTTHAYQSYVQLATPESDSDRARYRGYFFPDRPGTYELELRVHNPTCNYGIVDTTSITATCTQLAQIGDATATQIDGTQGRYELDASGFVDVESDQNLVFWWDWVAPDYENAEQSDIVFQEMVYLNTPIYNNDAAIASFRPSMAGRYQARVVVTNGCHTIDAVVTIDHSCEVPGGSVNGTAQQINLMQVSDGAAGVSEMLVDLEPLVPDFCGAESYRWEVVNWSPEFDDLVDPGTSVGGAMGRRFGEGLGGATLLAIVAFHVLN